MGSDIAQSLFSLAKHNQGRFKSLAQAEYLLRFFENGVYSVSKNMQFGDYDQKTDRNSRTVRFHFEANSEGIQKITKETPKETTLYWENTPEFLALAAERELARAKAAYKDELHTVAGQIVDAQRVTAIHQSTLLKINQELNNFLEKTAPIREQLGDSFEYLKNGYEQDINKTQLLIDEQQSVIQSFGLNPSVLQYADECCEAFFNFGVGSEGRASLSDLNDFIDSMSGYAPADYPAETGKTPLSAAFNMESYKAAAYGFSPNASTEAIDTVSTVVRNRWKTEFLTESLCLFKPFTPKIDAPDEQNHIENPAIPLPEVSHQKPSF